MPIAAVTMSEEKIINRISQSVSEGLRRELDRESADVQLRKDTVEED